MRARGASVTDIVVLVVAADDGVMPQTLEAIHHANAANVPVLVAINKIDRPGSNLEKIKQELAANKVVAEEWGGETIFCEVSAKENIGIENLLEMILLNAEMLDLKANPDTMARGSIIESKLDKGRGPVATILIKQGTLKVGHAFVAGTFFGKVKALIDDRGEKVESGGPSIPLEVLGFSGVPNAGDDFMVVENDRKAHQIALKRKDSTRVVGLKAKEHVKLDNLYANISKGEVKDLNIIVKADVQGSIEAVSQAMNDIHFENVQINLIHGAVGGITETDINLAAASDAVVIGFNIRPTEKAKILYEDEGVDVRLYTVIYHAIDDIKKAVEGMLEPEFKEIITGRAEVRNTFNITKIGTIAGSFITSGKIKRNSDARLIRDSAVVYTGKVGSLRRFKDDVKEVGNGYECGIGLENYNDIKVTDVVETYIMEEVKRNL
jgi:translation initiation factor IF-2